MLISVAALWICFLPVLLLFFNSYQYPIKNNLKFRFWGVWLRPRSRHWRWILQIAHDDGRHWQHERRQNLFGILSDSGVGETYARAVQSDPGAVLQLHHQTEHRKDHSQDVEVVGHEILLTSALHRRHGFVANNSVDSFYAFSIHCKEENYINRELDGWVYWSTFDLGSWIRWSNWIRRKFWLNYWLEARCKPHLSVEKFEKSSVTILAILRKSSKALQVKPKEILSLRFSNQMQTISQLLKPRRAANKSWASFRKRRRLFIRNGKTRAKRNFLCLPKA